MNIVSSHYKDWEPLIESIKTRLQKISDQKLLRTSDAKKFILISSKEFDYQITLHVYWSITTYCYKKGIDVKFRLFEGEDDHSWFPFKFHFSKILRSRRTQTHCRNFLKDYSNVELNGRRWSTPVRREL